MGEVFRARDEKLNRDVALKVLRGDFAAHADRLQRLLREAQTLAALNHSHIAQIYGIEEATVDGAPVQALVLEFVEGEDLAQRLARAPMPLDEALATAGQIAEALEAAHDAGIIHRDLKPANVKLRPDGEVKVLDFGLAKMLAVSDASSAPSFEAQTITSPAVTQAGVILGTAAYMSPEQARGRPLDKRTDIFAFGAVLFEMLTGRRAFDGDTVTDVLAAIVTRPPDWTALPKNLPAAIEQLLRRCLEKDHRLRLRDIGEARVVLSGNVSAAPAVTIPPRPVRAVPLWLPWLVAAIAIAAAVGVTLWPRTPNAPVRKIEVALPADARDAQLSPDGTRIAFRTVSHVFVMDLERGETREMVAAARPFASGLAWSPDSQSLAYSGPEPRVWKVAIAGGPPLVLSTIPETGQLFGLDWREDGSIVFAVWRGGLYVIPAAGGEPTPLAKIDPKTEIDFHDPLALPDGRVLVITHLLPDPGGSPNLYRLESIDGARREVLLDGQFAPIAWLETGRLLLRRSDVNAGLWAVPFGSARPLNVDAGQLVAAAAVQISTSRNGLLLYAVETAASAAGELVWVDRAGRVVGQIGPSQPHLAGPTLSRDQRYVAFAAGENADIWIRDLESGSQSRVTTETAAEAWPVWFPDGRRVLYRETPGPAGDQRERLVSRSRSGGERVELAAGGSPTLTPDGRYVLYLVDDRGSRRLRYAAVGSDGRLSPALPFFKTSPEPVITGAVVSPSGTLVAYVEPHPGGRPDVFVTRFPSGEGRWQISADGGRAPLWGRKGDLFFVAGPNDGPKQMMVVGIDDGPTVSVGSPLKLFDVPEDLQLIRPGGSFVHGLAAFDVKADGTQFLMVRSRGAGQPARRWVLVENWLAEFPALRR